MLQRLCLAITISLALTGSATAFAPYSLQQIFVPPYPMGVGPRQLTFSDDGCYLACAYNDNAWPSRDVWVYDTQAGAWFKHTDFWSDREARKRLEFNRELNKARQDWEAAHPAQDKAAVAQEASAEQAEGAASGKPEQFDEQKRIEDFEKELLKEQRTFAGVGQLLFRRGSHELFWIFEGAVFSLDLDQPGAEPRERLRHDQGFGALGRIEGSDALTLVSDADVFLWWPVDAVDGAAGRLRQLTSGGWGDRPHTEGYALSTTRADGRCGRWLAHCTRDYTGVRRTQIMDMLGETPYSYPSMLVRPGDTPEGVSLTLSDLDATPPWPFEIKLPKDEPFYYLAYIGWTPAAAVAAGAPERLLLSVISGDTQHFRVYLVTPPEDKLGEPAVELIYHEYDDKWICWERTGVNWTADGGIVLQSEREGLSALYRLLPGEAGAAAEVPAAAASADTAGDEAAGSPEGSAAELQAEAGSYTWQPLFKPAGEVLQLAPLAHSPRIAIRLQGDDPSCTALGLLNLADGAFCWLTATDAVRGDEWTYNENESQLAYLVADGRTFTNLALRDLPEAGGLPAVPENFILTRDTPQWQAWADSWDQRFIDVPGSAGPIRVKLYLPPNWHAGGSYPLLLWAHGAGYAQTVNRQPGFLELFHPWAAEEKCWIVAEVDYRGSSGYGRDWRVDVWGRLGTPEVEDLVAAKHYLADNYGADARRTALWGWSYGGFLTLMALGLAPGEFPVGCAVAPVTRWENYHSYFAQCRLGTPAEHPDQYELSSAETCLKYIQDDLLIIHGLRDDNTVFQSVAQYLEKSHELGVNVELKLFPSDSHGISNEQHYLRVFEAVVDFCEAHWD